MATRRKTNGTSHNGNGHTNHDSESKPETPKNSVYQLSETPFFWNLWTVMYLLIGLPWYAWILYLTLQTDDDARAATSFLHKGVVPKDKNYALECGFDAFLDKVFDVFTISHGVGWFIVGLAYRSFPYTVFFSLVDELCEVWWRCCYPNFMECWWDAILLDMVLTNAVGAYIGVWVIERYVKRPFHWWDAMKRDPLKRYYTTGPCMLAKIMSLFNVFGFKWVLWIPSNHWINVLHLAAIVVVFVPTIAEGYNNLKHGTRSWWWSAIMFASFTIDGALPFKMGYATPLFRDWDIWGKIIAGITALCIVPTIHTYSA